MTIRLYNPDQDLDAVRRIWREVGWIDSEEHEKALAVFLKSGRSFVADLDGDPECMVNTDLGTLRYLNEEIPLCCVTGVTTSRIARKRGLASRATAHALAQDANDEAAVAILGAFEQGFYNQLGFGNGSYECWCTFDPALLDVDVVARTPSRLTEDDWDAVHRSRLGRRRGHGSCSILSPELTRAEMMWSENGFGLGYVDDAGDLTHHVWCSTKEALSGPYRVEWMAYRKREQFVELLALIKSFGDQIHAVRIHEPGDLQFQDLLRQPFKMRQITRRSPHEQRSDASSYWQIRVLDLVRCLERTHLDGGSVSFNLDLTDPVEAHLPQDSSWRGIGGTYTVTLGPESSASPGSDRGLLTLRASVGAFTRMWLGVRSPSALAWTDEIHGPEELLRELDGVLRLPIPSSDWDF